jgi:hypothetical protein
VISQRGCAVDLRCRGGSVSYEGSVSGGAVEFAGESGAGIPATCRATITGATMRGTCTPRALPDLPTCGFTANAKK